MTSSSAEFNTPNIQASEALLVLHAKIKIDAPAAVVFRSLRNTETWRDWNRFIPKVNVTYQPPENDSVTAAEIQELVRNTSIAGSFDSDLTDGGVGNRRPRSPEERPPPRYRLNSVASQMSQNPQNENSQNGEPRMSESLDPNDAGPLDQRGSVSSIGSGVSKNSGARLFQEAQDSRRSSLAAGQEPPPIENKLESRPLHRASVAIPPPNTGGKKKGKPKYTQVVTAGGGGPRSIAAHQALMSVYGEPSVRLQIKTKMTFFMRMKPASPSELTEGQYVVIDISRPDDPVSEKGTTALTRSKTHTLDRAGAFRVVWATDDGSSSLMNFKNVFSSSKVPSGGHQVERVHEIEVTGEETCLYKTWECQVGPVGKANKKKNADFLQKMLEVWCSGIKDFCEGLHAPQIDRRDFSITAEDVPLVIQSLT